MKRKEKKAMLLKLHQEVKLLSQFTIADVYDWEVSKGFCAFIFSSVFFIRESNVLYRIMVKYKPHTSEFEKMAYWFNPGDWKIRLSFLEEVMKVELNPFYKLAYKLGLYTFKY